jgi:phytoene dehydrogenase-like protein
MADASASELKFQTKPSKENYDAVIIGSGPNGLAAAITLAQAGRSVLVLEAAPDIGGGTRSSELTQPGFIHDVCSAVHPLGVSSPFFKSVPLKDFGLEWIYPEASLVHALTPDRAVVLYPDMEKTIAGLGVDGDAYRRLLAPFMPKADALLSQILQPFNPFPKTPILMARFGLRGMSSAVSLANRYFKEDAAKGLFAGMAGHSVLPLEQSFTGAVGLMFGVIGHLVSWPIAKGGSQAIAHAMARYLQSLGGEIVVQCPVKKIDDLPEARAYLFNTTPSAMSAIADDSLPAPYRRKLEAFRHGPGVYKIDWALSGPIPWKNEDFKKAATVHIGGTLEEIAAAERAPWENRCAVKPFVLLCQQSLFDKSRVPKEGQHTGWAYCHVPHGSTENVEERIINQIERFAPGFRDLILESSTMDCRAMATHNLNYIGGDITGGVMDIGQLFKRPVNLFSPYSTPNPKIFICSSSTPPGAGVHGMCGYFAAKAALKKALRS